MSRHIFVSGAGRGIGLSLVEHLLHKGHHVWATYRKPDRASALLRLDEMNNHLTIAQLDVTDEQQLAKLVIDWKEVRFDWIINNAGIYGPKEVTFQTVTTEAWLDVLRTNTIAPYQVSKAFYPNLIKSSERKLVFISSKMGSIADNKTGGAYIYRSSKAALNQVIKSLSIDLIADEVCVLALHPGWVKTAMGGENGDISVDVSVTGLITVIECADLEASGQLWNYNGQLLPW